MLKADLDTAAKDANENKLPTTIPSEKRLSKLIATLNIMIND
jgi:hypothetical protein